MTVTLHQLHIRLDQLEPAIEREFIVPSSLRLDRLHQVIQVVMGWEDGHQHAFVVGGPHGKPVENEARTLAQIAPGKGSRFGYRYDFGDDWYHVLKVKAVLAHAPTPAPLHCLKATGACPPEDCGGPWGYARLLAALADPAHEDHEEMLEWVDEGFSPAIAAAEVDRINVVLAGLARRWKLPAADTAAPGTPGGATPGAAKPARQRPPPGATSALESPGPAPAGQADLAGRPPATGDLVAVATPDKATTREQRAFNRLAEQIRRKRQDLADWQAWLDGYRERMAGEYEPLRRRQYDLELQLVRRLDAVLEPGSGRRLGKATRATLLRYLDERIHELLDAGGAGEDELAALLRKHADEDVEDLREQDRQFERELAESMIGGLFGEDVLDGHQGDDAESLFRHVDEKLRERSAAAGARQPRGKRAEAAAERRAQAEREASQSVRDIFRKLASSLHPDRELDPAQRARKTELMQQATRAYQHNDLLQLLTLQVQGEQIDARHLAGLPDARLKHYNAVLRDQVAALEDEVAALAQAAAMELQVLDPAPSRSGLERQLRMRVAQLRQWCAEAEGEIAALDDPSGREALAAVLQARFRDQDTGEEVDLDVLFGLADATAPGFIGAFQPPGPGRKSSGSRKETKKRKRR